MPVPKPPTAKGALFLGLLILLAGCGTRQTPVATVDRQPLNLATVDDWRKASWVVTGLPQSPRQKVSRPQVEVLAAQQVVVNWALTHHVLSRASAQNQARQELTHQVIPHWGTLTFWRRAATVQIGEAAVIDWLSRQILLERAFQQVTARVKPPPASAMLAYYQANQSFFVTPPAVLARVIVVPSQAEAEAVVRQWQKGASFAALAARYSTDRTTRFDGGSLGWIRLGAQPLPPGYRSALSQLSPDHWSIVHNRSGYSIIDVQASRNGGEIPYRAVAPAIQAELWQNARQQAFQQWVQGLLARHPIHVTVQA